MGVPQEPRLTSTGSTMQKTKTTPPSKSRQMIHNWWKGKSAPSSPCTGKGFWCPETDNTWCNTKSKVVLSPTSLLHLTEVERVALQKVAMARLQTLNLGVPITIPKDGINSKSKKNRFLLKRRAVSSNVTDSTNPNNPQTISPKALTETKTSGWVFGIPLAKCISNDFELRRTNNSTDPTISTSDMSCSPLRNRKSSSSSGGALSNDESLSESDGGLARRSNLIDALLLPPSSRLDLPMTAMVRTNASDQQLQQHQQQQQQQLQQQQLQHLQQHTGILESTLRVPYVVSVCCQHLQTHGIGVLGIFRIGSSKKRTIQLRDEFDTGHEVQLTEEHNPHDVGAVLKEFFRDLPDPLLTRSLYSAFVATRKIKEDRQRIDSVNLLVSLLPPCNRDTLWALLTFLNAIARHSTDYVDDNGEKVPGNKMDAHNLATLFGPNILHKAKGGAFQVESLERAEERVEVISVVKEMIEHQTDVFELSAELHDETLRNLLKTHPEQVDYIFQRRTISISVEPDRDSTSSVCEESDSSSMPPHSPGYSSETDALHPRSFNEAFHQMPPSTTTTTTTGARLHPTIAESRTLIEFLQSHASSTPSLPSIAIGIACPRGGGGSSGVGSGVSSPTTKSVSLPQSGCSPPSSVSAADRISTGRRKPHQDLRIEITTDEDDYHHHHHGPRTVPLPGEDRRRTGICHGSRPDNSSLIAPRRISGGGGKRQTLAVPSTTCSGKDSDCSSTGATSPRHSPYSSRSPSSSSPSPEPTWMQCPPRSPSLSPCYGQSSAIHRNWSATSSSKHRPLGLSSCSNASNASCSPRPGPGPSLADISSDWDESSWMEWNRINQQKGDEIQEQETLV